MKKYIRNNSYILRKIAGQSMLVPTDRELQNASPGAIVINEVTELVWEQLMYQKTIQELADELITEYDVDSSTANKDLSTLIRALLEHSAVIELDSCE